jgi:hypothetical protein
MEDPHFIPHDNNRKPSPPVVHASKTFVATSFFASLWVPLSIHVIQGTQNLENPRSLINGHYIAFTDQQDGV